MNQLRYYIPLAIGILSLVVLPHGRASAADIQACYGQAPCPFKSKYQFVQLSLRGMIEKGDLERLKKSYTLAAFIECVNRRRPGSYEVLPPGMSIEQWKKTHPGPSHGLSKEDIVARAECNAEPISNKRAKINGVLNITSAGGDLNEAMSIGEWIRKSRLGVATYNECASACVWILAAGLSRTVLAKIVIHRPYFINPGPSGRLRSLLRESRSYFDEMGVPAELAERMFSTPPDKAAILSRSQIDYYRLDQDDMAFKEEQDFARAKRLGISREEYTDRMQRLNEWQKRDPCPAADLSLESTRAWLACFESRERILGLIRGP